jgi:four helix bundle protein
MTNDKSNFNDLMINDPMDKAKSKSVAKVDFNLEERTSLFGQDIIKFAKLIPRTPINDKLVSQFIAAGTSIGANYAEANDAESKKDFRHKIGICRKESKETKYWLRMISTSEPKLRDGAVTLWKEAKELNLIFAAITRSCDK